VHRKCGRTCLSAGESLSDRGVARVVKRPALAAGLDPASYAGHSLRAGLATAAAKAGKSERAIMRQTGHKSLATMWRYVREAELFEENAAKGLL
jgi:site-specific recombinase XerD